MELDISLEDARWQVAGLPDLADRVIAATLLYLGGVPGAEISLMGCDDARIATLNGTFRDKASATNVLSWPAQELVPPAGPLPDPDGAVPLGDIAISYDTCAREAAEQGKPFEAHVTHLIVHGVLHLFGYDHIRDEDATQMEGIEVEILGKLGLPDPYM